MTKRHLIFIFGIWLFLHRHCSAQIPDTSCKQIYEGYIVRTFEKCDPYTVCNSDVFFITTKPKLKLYADSKYYNRLIDSNIYLVNEHFYEDVNLVKTYTSYTYSPYYMSTAFDSLIMKSYSVFVYRVMLAGFITEENLEKYIAIQKDPHKSSGLRHLRRKKQNVAVLYPRIIVCW